MEASALQAPAGLARARISVGAPLLRMRSDDQLLALFRAGNEDAFRVIHDRYRQRLFAYTRQMLPGSAQDAEDALQDVFVRAYSGLRANRRELTLRPWLYRVAHNRCVDEMRRPLPPPPAVLYQSCVQTHDPISRAEQRESLRRLIADLQRLPAQQRSALLMRELGGMSYSDVAAAMDVSVPAVKSLLVRARIGLTLAAEARDTACVEIRDELTLAHDRGVRSSGTVRRHLADCGGCRQFQSELRSSRRQLAALAPTLGPLGLVAKMLGIGGGGAGGAGAAATGGATATTGAVIGGGMVASTGTFAAGATHVATLIAAAVVTAGGAVAIQHSITPAHHHQPVHAKVAFAPSSPQAVAPAPAQAAPYEAPASAAASPSSATPKLPLTRPQRPGVSGAASTSPPATSISGGDNIVPTAAPPSTSANPTGTGTPGATSTGTGTPTGTSEASGATSTSGTSSSSATTSTGSFSSSTGTSSAGGGTPGTPATTGSSPSTNAGAPGSPTGAGPTTASTTGSTPGAPAGT
jgi:RNA polymerase sigma factor (sigma-70 family)